MINFSIFKKKLKDTKGNGIHIWGRPGGHFYLEIEIKMYLKGSKTNSTFAGDII